MDDFWLEFRPEPQSPQFWESAIQRFREHPRLPGVSPNAVRHHPDTPPRHLNHGLRWIEDAYVQRRHYRLGVQREPLNEST